MTRPDLAHDLYGLEWLDYFEEEISEMGIDPEEWESDDLPIVNDGGGIKSHEPKPSTWAGNLPEMRG